MKRYGAVVVCALSTLMIVACSSIPPAAPTSGGGLAGKSIPITVKTIDDGVTTRMMVQVSIGGGQAIPVMLDTGSQGLRVFADAVGGQGITPTQTPTSETFGTGVRLNGIVATAPLVVGGLPTAGAIPIMVIQNVDCDPAVSFCQPQWANEGVVIADNFGAQGILGIGRMYGQNGVFSPMLQLDGGVPNTYSVHLADAASGQIVFDQPPASPLATWSAPPDNTPQQANGINAWNDTAVDACWSIGGAPAICVPTAFDTGSPAMNLAQGLPGVPKPNAASVLPNGLVVGLSPSVGAVAFKSLTSGLTNDTLMQSHSSAGDAQINSGWTWFHLLTISYDVADGRVSVA